MEVSRFSPRWEDCRYTAATAAPRPACKQGNPVKTGVKKKEALLPSSESLLRLEPKPGGRCCQVGQQQVILRAEPD